MTAIDPDIVRQLRDAARHGASVPDILRQLISLLPPGGAHTVTLINYMRRSFCLTLGQASPIPGWAPDHMAELSDSRLDDLIMPEVLKTRGQWDCEVAVPKL